MSEAIKKGYIAKKDKGSGEYENLYLEGIALLQQLSGAQWTDYNEHDPGVTILENLAYTLTNLSYKTGLPVQDILTESKGSKLESGDNGFFVPSEILTTNPVNILDLRKVFIDGITNVKNVWIKSENQPPLNLSDDLPPDRLKGLYHIYIEMYEYDSDVEARRQEAGRIVGETRELFHAHRNLCEDLYDISVFEPMQLQMKLKLTLDDIASGEEVLANIYYEINDYLTHEVRFHSLWELQANNEDINTIFDGPLLENGFIGDNELKDKLNTIIPSDIIKLMAKVKGVVSVDFFELAYYSNDKPAGQLTIINEEGLLIPENLSPVLIFPESNTHLVFESEGVEFLPDLKGVQKQLSYIKAINYGNFKSVSRAINTIDIPEGSNLGIASYYSIREQFPVVYGIGQFGLQKGLPTVRYAQVNQLKAYLLPFDQLMTNFLSQLSHLYTIYDVKGEGLQSYFYQELEDMPDLVALIRSDVFEKEEASLDHWKTTLQHLNVQADRSAIERLNQVADHLLARFGEQFPSYALRKINTHNYDKKLTSRQFENNLLSWKRKLIADYGQLSYNRAKACDYTQAVKITSDYTIEDPEKKFTPAIVQKMAILMGIKNFEARSLSHIMANSGITMYKEKEGVEVIREQLEIVHAGEGVTIVLEEDIIVVDELVENLRDWFYFLGSSDKVLKDTLKNGVLLKNYLIKKSKANEKGAYYILFVTEEKKSNIIHASDSEEEAKQAIAYAINFLTNLNDKCEGVYLIEHLLLAPPYTGNYFGFSFTLSLDDSRSLTFEQTGLKSCNDRNLDVQEITSNLNGGNTTPFRVVSINEKFVIQIFDENEQQLAVTTNTYDDEQAAQQDLALIVRQLNIAEPMQLVDKLSYFAYYGNQKVNETFFSFQMSFVLPSWPVRFQHNNFRTKFDNIAYEQVPIHIAFQSYWLDLRDMAAFEKHYYQWVGLSGKESVEAKMTSAYALINLIQQFKQLTKQ